MSSDLKKTGNSQKAIDWESFYVAANKPIIGYDGMDDKIIIMKGSGSAASEADGLVYDVMTGSWSHVIDIDTEQARSNFATSHTGKLIFKEHVASGGVTEWSSASAASTAFKWVSKDFDLNYPGVKKKLYKVIIHSVNGANVDVKIYYNSKTSISSAADGQSFDASTNPLSDATTVTKNILSITTPTAFSYVTIALEANGTVAADFAVNDIALVYRVLSIH